MSVSCPVSIKILLLATCISVILSSHTHIAVQKLITFKGSPVESSVSIDIHVELVGSLLEQIADAERLAVLGGDDEGGAPIKIRRINLYTFL